MSFLLRKHIEEIISRLTDQEFDHIVSHFTSLKRNKHQFIIQENEDVKNDYWVIKGCLKAYTVDSDGKEHILSFAMENWWVTDYNAYHNKVKSGIFISCIEDSELLAISLENREKLCREMHKMEHFWNVKSKYGYIALQKRILSLLKNSAQERYEQLLEQYPQLFQRVPKKMIASYLGVSRETLSRFSSSTHGVI
jgi:CRP/FNR family transcriptional regulator, cyclic AMP receptor protein